MKDRATSKALGANLAEANAHGITVPMDHEHFTELSISYWGIHQKSKELMLEYHHPYSNRQLVVEKWREVLLGHFWFYNSLEEAEGSFAVLIDIGKELLYSDVRERERHRIIQTLLELVEHLSKQQTIREQTIHACLDTLKEYFAHNELDIVSNSRYFQRCLNGIAQLPQFSNKAFEMTKTVLQKCTAFWESTSNIEGWLRERSPLLSCDYAQIISSMGRPYFSQLWDDIKRAEEWHELTRIPSVDQIANHFHESVDRIDTPVDRIYLLSYLMHLPGMDNLLDRLLMDMNRALKGVQSSFKDDEFISFLENRFGLFGAFKSKHMNTLLDCFLTLGKEAADTNNQKIVDFCVEKLIRFGFVSPGVVHITDDWQVQVDTNHLKNIRTWLELVEYAPSMMRRLLSAIVIELRLGGIFISDTDLFQRDITKLLNAKIASYYKHIKQLCRIFPVYFTEIGCEGKLRDLTTAIDELSLRQDKLLHFLRKQTHAESNSTNIQLTKAIMQFWYDGQLEHLKDLVPSDILESIDLNSEWFVHINKILHQLCDKEGYTPEQLLCLGKEELETKLSGISICNARDEKRLQHLIEIHALLREKYSLEMRDVVPTLRQYTFLNKTHIDNLAYSIANRDIEKALKQVYCIMHDLNTVILDPKDSEAWESIYRKRHIAAGIPSMYGQYREPKFEALGLTFRLEKLASRLMEQLIQPINLNYVTARTLRRIHNVLSLFQEGMIVDGIYSHEFEYHLKMLEFTFTSSSFSLAQYINILHFLEQDVKEIINAYFLRIYDEPLRIITSKQSEEQGISETEKQQISAKISEEFYREVISSAFLIQTLDNFIATSLNAARNTQDSYPKDLIHKAMTYNPDLISSPLYEQTPMVDNPVFLGAKAYFLKKLHSLGFPIPHGFVMTTELFRHEEAILRHPLITQELDEIIQEHVAMLEKSTGRQFGNPERPLLLSVRSGSAFSMPGAMHTFLNVGMNDQIAGAFCLQPSMSWGAWDCYRRLLQNWGMANGIERDAFDNIIQDFKTLEKVVHKAQFSAKQMREIAYEYKELLHRRGIHFEQDPFLQLRHAIFKVIESWSSYRTKVYRERLEIADEWGTAVIIQKMVLGNINSRSGSGVAFTCDPCESTQGVNLYGDYTTCSQGEDIVAGLVHALPMSEHQHKKELRDVGLSLETAFPRIYDRLVNLSTEMIDKHGFGHQEIEFTFESDKPEDLYILQIRTKGVEISDKRSVFTVPQDQMHLVGRGVGIGGGALSGIMAINMDDLEILSARYPNEKLVLVRPDTVPDDIGMIFECDGLLTGRGGITSHAAVTATRLGKVCIVGCKDFAVNEVEKSCTIGGIKFKPGDKISIEGYLGNVYTGQYPTKYAEIG